MNHRKNTGHSVSSLFSLLLFGVFVLFLILMLLFSARIYQQTVKQTDSDSELGTAATYLTTKFRQHDRGDEIFSGSLDDIPALCFRDDIKGKEYEVFAARQERKEVVTRVITRLLISLWYEKAFFYVAENYLVIFQCPRTGNFLF